MKWQDLGLIPYTDPATSGKILLPCLCVWWLNDYQRRDKENHKHMVLILQFTSSWRSAWYTSHMASREGNPVTYIMLLRTSEKRTLSLRNRKLQEESSPRQCTRWVKYLLQRKLFSSCASERCLNNARNRAPLKLQGQSNTGPARLRTSRFQWCKPPPACLLPLSR